MMLELIICCFLVFAVAYWVTLWTARRRDDVLHGRFVAAEPEREANVAFAAAAPPSVFPKKPVIETPAPPPAQVETPDSLQSLLASIKHELKNASQM